MYFEVIAVEYLNNYRIYIKFKDNKCGEIDLKEYVSPYTVFKKFTEMNYFKSFKVEYGTLTWGNGELDIAPETLYLKTTGAKEIEWGKSR